MLGQALLPLRICGPNRVMLTDYCHGAPWENAAVCADYSTEGDNPLREKIRATNIRPAIIRAGGYPHRHNP